MRLSPELNGTWVAEMRTKMAVRIIISTNADETRMGLVKDNILTEYMVERSGQQPLVGSIFLGKVSNVVRGIQAAFIDIGLEQNAFFYMGDHKDVTEGESLMVQIVKDARGSKGPTAVKEITLPGKYLVLMPLASHIGISKKITDKEERERLLKICGEHRPENMGIVIRTAATGISSELLKQDINELVADWRILEARCRLTKKPGLLRRELDLTMRIVRDYLSTELTEIITDSEQVCRRLQELFTELPAGRRINIVRYDRSEDIFSYYGYDEDIAGISDRTVSLPSGGYLVFDNTEAMTVIDVNSGSFRGRENLEETAMQINREAAVMIARQLRLRDIGGIIIVDFIDMHTEEHKKEILTLLESSFIGDRMKPKIQDITVLNLVEITRRKSRHNLSSVLYSPCPVCNGSGRVQSRESLALEIKNRLRILLKQRSSSKKFLVVANPWLAEWLRENDCRAWERELGCELNFSSDASLQPESFMLLDNTAVDK